MKTSKTLLKYVASFFIWGTILTPLASLAHDATGINSIVANVGMQVTLGVLQVIIPSAISASGASLCGVTVENWTADIINNLFKNNEFARRAFNADNYVLNGKVVHIPVAGAPSTIKKNLAIFPAAAVKRTDTDINYSIDTFYSTPRHIENIEKYELAYDKRQSVVGEDQSAIIQAAIDSLLYRWAPLAANCIETDGADVAASMDGAVGNRRAFTKQAFADIKLKWDKNNINNDGRIALLSADHYNQFLASLSEAERTDVGRVADLKTGLVGMYLGIQIYMRSSVLRYRGANLDAVAVVDEQADAYAADPTDRGASLFYQESCVERALGSVEMFSSENDPLYYGNVYSFTLRLGGRQRRIVGVWGVVEALA